MQKVTTETFFDYLADKRIGAFASEKESGNGIYWQNNTCKMIAEIKGYHTNNKEYYLNLDFFKSLLTKAEFTKLQIDCGLKVDFPAAVEWASLTEYVTYSDGSVYNIDLNIVVK